VLGIFQVFESSETKIQGTIACKRISRGGAEGEGRGGAGGEKREIQRNSTHFNYFSSFTIIVVSVVVHDSLVHPCMPMYNVLVSK
jgi:hypothetical protein